jgi:hypothetical protein
MMRIEIRRENGVRAQAVLLDGTATRLRVAVPGSVDAEDWIAVDGGWQTEDGKRVEIEAILADGTESPEFLERLCAKPKTRVAGGQ